MNLNLFKRIHLEEEINNIMKQPLFNKLKAYELTKEKQHQVWAKGTKLDGCIDTSGDEDCLPEIKKKPYKQNITSSNS